MQHGDAGATMEVSVQPVVRGEFLFNDVLLVDVGGHGRRHPRASESELRDLLNGKNPKDQVAHFYEAQLIHYGLQRSKDKNAAKVRLGQALNTTGLVLPPHLRDMEAQMKKEYASAVRKAKAQSKAGPIAASPGETSSKPQKRKAIGEDPESSKRTKVSMNLGNFSINIEQNAPTATAKKTPKPKADSKTVPNVSAATPKKAAKPKALSNAKPSTAARLNCPETASTAYWNPGPIGPTSFGNRTKQTARKSAPTGGGSYETEGGHASYYHGPLANAGETTRPTAEASDKAKPSTKKQTQPDAKMKAEPKVKADAKVRAEPKVKSEPKFKAEPKVKAEPKIKKEPEMKAEPSVKYEPTTDEDLPMPDAVQQSRAVTGVYNITSRQIEEEMSEFADRLRLFLCTDEEHDRVWGGFNLANMTGVLCIDKYGSATEATFGWRARNTSVEAR